MSTHPDYDHDHDASSHHHRQAHTDHSGHERMFRRRFWVSLALSLPVVFFSEFVQGVFGYTAPTFPGSVWITPALSTVVFAYGGVPFLSMAQTELENREPGMMMLISLAITVAFVYSIASLFIEGTTPFFWELVTLIDIMLLGHWMEMRSVRQASGALDELAKLMPDTAERVTEGGDTEEVPVSELSEGDVVLVRPGASVPADGEVVGGESSVDESMITGESRPVDKDSGSEVIAGTVNQDGSLRVRVTKTGDETALAGIMRLVEDAQQSKVPDATPRGPRGGVAVLRRARRRGSHGRRVGSRGRVQRRRPRTRRDGPRHRVSARARSGGPARGRNQHLDGRPERDARPRPNRHGRSQKA
ncbi:Copper-exporting P-type ATPase B [Haloferax massiliensis]|uniref:Copper-exporting P-type ATPase B n=1 Tax=Haloferax massiliensis TaxID=1476858 RepID=A0A0D6JUH0_9EURY|nr:Copper-exporting P-type ATPase B [Haloferax massiliensis]